MRLVILLSSILFARGVQAFDSTDVKLIDAYKILQNNPAMFKSESAIDAKKFDQDEIIFKNQNRDITNWGELDANEWLSFETWRKHRKIKDENKNWRQIFREATNQEIVGRVLKCIGLCQNYRGDKRSSVEYMRTFQCETEQQ